MDLQNLKENKDRILQAYAQELKPSILRCVRHEINWLISRSEDNEWEDLEDAYQERILRKEYSSSTKSNLRYYYRFISKKLNPNIEFMPRLPRIYEEPNDVLLCSKGYLELNPQYQAFLEAYVVLAQKAEKKTDTILNHCFLTSIFLRHLQQSGHAHLEEATETSVMSFFYADHQYEKQIRSYSYKEKLCVVFKNCMEIAEYSSGCRRILCMIPSFRYIRKNVAYLKTCEAEAIRNRIEFGDFTSRERAIMMLLLYTGMRSCDVASIRLRDINWKKETISITQQKTSELLEMAMLPAVGNAIFEYLQQRTSSSIYLFDEATDCNRHITAKKVRSIANKAYRMANIRQEKGAHKGTHLFRHHVATAMLANGVQRPIISRTLGHTDPGSLETYLHTDFAHLKEYALSLKNYPVSEEVWNI